MILQTSRLFVACLCLGLIGPKLFADQLVYPIGKEPFRATLQQISPEGKLVFALPSKGKPVTRSYATSELVRWSLPVQLPNRCVVLLTDGSRLATSNDWSGKGAVRLEGKNLVVLNPVLGQLKVPKQRVAALLYQVPRNLLAQDLLIEELTSHSPVANKTDDQLQLVNGDILQGEVTALSAAKLQLETETGKTSVSMQRVLAVQFSRSKVNPTANLWVGLTDGSLLLADRLQSQGKQLTLTLPNGDALSIPSVKSIASVQSTGQNPKSNIQYFTALKPLAYRHTPYLELSWPLGIDRAVSGGRLRSNKQLILRGLGMHSASRVTYRVPSGATQFTAEITVDCPTANDTIASAGSAVFRVYLSQNGNRKEAYTSPIVRGGSKPIPVRVALDEARAITLVVDYADRGDECDHGIWCNARVVEKHE